MSASVLNHVKHFLTSSLITMLNSLAVSHTVCMHVAGLPVIFGDTGRHSLGRG